MDAIRYMHVDDEPGCLIDLAWEVKKINIPMISMGTFTDPKDALQFLENNEIDLLFLDIEMNSMTGFEFLSCLDEINFEVVFTTAYSQYAIEAFKSNALDYLLKPINSNELKRIIEKFQEKSRILRQNSKALFNEIIPKNQLAIFNGDGYDFVDFDHIIRLEASSNYTYVYTTQKRYLVAKSLVEFKKKLPPNSFVVPHRSHIINLKHIRKLEYGKSPILSMSDGTDIKVSRDRFSDLKKILLPE